MSFTHAQKFPVSSIYSATNCQNLWLLLHWQNSNNFRRPMIHYKKSLSLKEYKGRTYCNEYVSNRAQCMKSWSRRLDFEPSCQAILIVQTEYCFYELWPNRIVPVLYIYTWRFWEHSDGKLSLGSLPPCRIYYIHLLSCNVQDPGLI